MEKENLKQFFKELHFFKTISEENVIAFVKTSTLKKYKKNEAVFIHGDSAEHFYIVINGWIKIHRETPEGEEAVLGLLTKGDIFGDTAIFFEARYPYSAHCAEETEIAEIPANILREQAKNHPDILNSILKEMCHNMKGLRLENEHMALMSAPQRVGCLLLQLSADMVGKGGTFSFPYDKSLAATRLGMKPETFSRALAQLKPFGVTVKGSEITIQSYECLISYTCGHCSATPEECRNARCCEQKCSKK